MDSVIDRHVRSAKSDTLATAVGIAVSRDDREAMMYLLGRLDETIGDDKSRYVYETHKSLREVLCAALDIYPDPFPDDPVPITAVDDVRDASGAH